MLKLLVANLLLIIALILIAYGLIQLWMNGVYFTKAWVIASIGVVLALIGYNVLSQVDTREH